jgi:predicted metalloprotease with PDZ domain
MERTAGEFAKGVGERPGEGRNWAGNAEKMLFRGNEPKILLQIQELAIFGAKNELLFERKKRQSKPKNGHKSTLSVKCTPGATAGRPYRKTNRRMDWGSKRTGMRPLRYGCAGLILACCFLLPRLAESSFAASEPIQYLLDLREPASHLAKVVMTVAGASPSTELQFPAWNNLYQIRDFARNIQELAADCDGAQEQLTRVDLNTWRSEAKPCEKLALRYAVYVAGSPPFSSALDSQHAFLNFATLLFYLPKERGRAAHVKLLIPAEWKVASLLEEDGDGFLAPNYDVLVDSPAEAGQFQDYSFSQDGATYRVVVDADVKDYSADRLLASLRKITATETALMRDVPFSRYTFILHFPREDGGGGMEHRNGTAITVRVPQLRDHWENLEGVAAHEFFHLWNVKRIRPQSLEPIDYIHGNDTRDLWFCEGVTSMYGELALLRAGLISRKTFYARLGSAIDALQSRPARFFQSAEESGLEAWFEKYNDYLRPERSISYYIKGELLGFLLDLALRHATGNGAGLDDVMRRLNEDFGRPGRYYTEADLRRLIAQVAPRFSGLEAFFADYVRGTRELDYDTYLGYAGLELEIEHPLEANEKATYRVKEIAHPSPEQVQVREGWLKGETTRAGANEP